MSDTPYESKSEYIDRSKDTHPWLVCILGPTNCGKSTLMDNFRSLNAMGMTSIGLIEIGKEMRKLHPPEYFNGQAAPEHTAIEAWNIFINKFSLCAVSGRSIVVCDGQPRDVKQAEKIMRGYPKCLFISLQVPHDVRVARALVRDGDDEAKLKLTQQRLVNDYRSLYEVTVSLAQKGKMPVYLNAEVSPDQLANTVMTVVQQLITVHQERARLGASEVLPANQESADLSFAPPPPSPAPSADEP